VQLCQHFWKFPQLKRQKGKFLGIFGKIVFKKGVKRQKSKRKVRIVRGREQKEFYFYSL
jgi:hypothetical protein